jgi:UDP-N-acetylglucosamine/UDP-N-acetylgalactosamine diphosphorylase
MASSSPVDIEALRSRYTAAGQAHLFTFWDDLSASEQSSLAQQLSALDVERVNQVYAKALEGEKEAAKLAEQKTELGPPPAKATVQTSGELEKEEHYARIGVEAIGKGQVGVLDRAHGWALLTPRDATTLVYHHTSRCSSCRQRELPGCSR